MSTDFRNYSNIKVNENMSCESPVFRAKKGQTDMTKLTVTFRNSANAPINLNPTN